MTKAIIHNAGAGLTVYGIESDISGKFWQVTGDPPAFAEADDLVVADFAILAAPLSVGSADYQYDVPGPTGSRHRVWYIQVGSEPSTSDIELGFENVNFIADDSTWVYPTRSDIEQIFGATNVAKWADLENLNDLDYIADRIQWACEQSTHRMNDRLRFGSYEIPFLPPFPASVVEMSARLAGVLLYEGRGIADTGDSTPPTDLMSAHRKTYNCWVRDVLAGRIHLSELSRAIDIPIVPVEADDLKSLPRR